MAYPGNRALEAEVTECASLGRQIVAPIGSGAKTQLPITHKLLKGKGAGEMRLGPSSFPRYGWRQFGRDVLLVGGFALAAMWLWWQMVEEWLR